MEVAQDIQDWAKENKCELNTQKTKIVEIRKTMHKYPEGQEIAGFEIVQSYKYLGM
jgi:hypothetical protein